MFKKLFYKEDGFTLVELLVTIAIVSILFGITTLSLSGIASQAQADMCDNEVYIVQSAIDIWNAANPGTPIALRTELLAGVIDPDVGTTFEDYLKTTTTGHYWWGADGEDLLQVTGGPCIVP